MTMTNTKHTPLPWDCMADGSAIKALNSGSNICETECGSQVASYFERQANAEFITRACNSHYELLDALESAHYMTQGWQEKVLQAIRKAKGEV